MDFEKLADEFIEEGAWQGSPRIAVELFAKWLAQHEAAQQNVQANGVCACANRHIGEDHICVNCGGVA